MDNLHKGLGGTLLLALIYIIFLQQCSSPGGSEIVKVDTLIHKITYDTNWYDTTRFKYVYKSVPKPYYDTIFVKRSDFTEQDFIFKYPATYQDIISDDTVSIHYTAQIRGYLDDIKIGYKLLQPFLVERTTLIETETTKRDKKSSKGLYLGLDVGGNKQSFGYFKPEVTLSLKRYHYSIGYNIPDKSITAGIKVKIL